MRFGMVVVLVVVVVLGFPSELGLGCWLGSELGEGAGLSQRYPASWVRRTLAKFVECSVIRSSKFDLLIR